jgi:hypothetical protein
MYGLDATTIANGGSRKDARPVFDRAGVDRHVGRSQNGLRKPIESDIIGINSSTYQICPVQGLASVVREMTKEESH